MKLFRNFKTKRQLREEIAMLKTIKPKIHIIERDVEPVHSCVLMEGNIPVEYYKKFIAKQLAEHLQPLIEYDVEDTENLIRKLTGTLYVAKRR